MVEGVQQGPVLVGTFFSANQSIHACTHAESQRDICTKDMLLTAYR